MPTDEFRIGDYWLSKHSTSRYWQRSWYDGQRRQVRRVSLGTESFQDAKDQLADWFFRTHRPRDAAPAEVALSVILTDYYESYAVGIASAQQQEIACGHLTAFFGDATIAEVTHKRQEAYIEQRRDRGIANSTISRELSVLRAALERARRRGELNNVPHVISAGQGAARDRRLTMPEFAALLDAAKSEHFIRFLIFAANTLSRPEALLDLKTFQIDTDNRLIHLNPPGREQTKKRRPTVPITDTLLPWTQGIVTNHVISYAGRRVLSVKKAFKLAREAAGLGSDVIPYTIRHTMATELRKRGVPMEEIAGFLGHKIGGVTEVYAKFDPNYLGLAARAIDAYFAELQKHCKRPLLHGSKAALLVSLV
jgi:integrase